MGDSLEDVAKAGSDGRRSARMVAAHRLKSGAVAGVPNFARDPKLMADLLARKDGLGLTVGQQRDGIKYLLRVCHGCMAAGTRSDGQPGLGLADIPTDVVEAVDDTLAE